MTRTTKTKLTPNAARLSETDAAYAKSIQGQLAAVAVAIQEETDAQHAGSQAKKALEALDAGFAASSDEFPVSDYPLAAAAVHATTLRLAATQQTAAKLRTKLGDRDLDTYVASQLAPYIGSQFSNVEVLVTANPTVEAPAAHERPVIFLVQSEPTRYPASGGATAKVQMHSFRAPWQTEPLTTHAARNLLPGALGLGVEISTALQRGDGFLDIVRIEAVVAPPELPAFDEVEERHYEHLGSLLNLSLASSVPAIPSGSGIPKAAMMEIEASQARHGVTSTKGSQREEGDMRITTIACRFYATLSDARVTEVAAGLDDLSLPNIGRVSSVRIDKDDDHPAGGTGRFILTADVVSRTVRRAA